MDESGVKLGINRKYAYSEIGTRAYSSNKETSEHYTLVGALTMNGFIAPMTLNGYVDTDAFLVYLEHFLIPNLKVGQTVIMDNLSVHKIPAVESLIKAANCFFLPLPPYSPDLSPIELAWSKIKSILRSFSPSSRDSLEFHFSNAISSISLDDCFSFFSHCDLCLLFE